MRHGHVDHHRDAQGEVDGLGQLARRVGQVAGGEGDHAEAEEGEEGQRDARDDVAERRVARERQQVRVQVGQGRDREHREDPDHHDDHDGLCSSNDLRAQDVQRGHHEQHEDAEGLDPARVAEDRVAGVAAEGDRDHRGDDRVHREQHPREHPGEVSFAPAADDVLEEAARRGVPRPQLGEGVALEHRDDAGEHEGDPDGGARHLPGRAQQREDAGSHHRTDPDERGVAHGQGPRRNLRRTLRARRYLLTTVHVSTVTCEDSPAHHPRGGGARPPRRGAPWSTKEAPHVDHRDAGRRGADP